MIPANQLAQFRQQPIQKRDQANVQGRHQLADALQQYEPLRVTADHAQSSNQLTREALAGVQRCAALHWRVSHIAQARAGVSGGQGRLPAMAGDGTQTQSADTQAATRKVAPLRSLQPRAAHR